MSSLDTSFYKRINTLTEQNVVDMSKSCNSMFNVLRGIHKEAFSAHVWDDSKTNFDYYLSYVTRIESKIEGCILKLQPHAKYRNELTAYLSKYISKFYSRDKPHQVFNTFQDQQRTIFEKYNYFTYGNELIRKLNGRNAELLFKDYKGLLFVPFAEDPVDELGSKVKTEEKRRTKDNGLQYIYIMLNKQNRYYKIGRSNRPEYRERTLQSQEPDIELIDKWIGNSEVEVILHRKYKEKRKRGEWFELTTSDVDDIRLFMQAITNSGLGQ